MTNKNEAESSVRATEQATSEHATAFYLRLGVNLPGRNGKRLSIAVTNNRSQQ